MCLQWIPGHLWLSTSNQNGLELKAGLVPLLFYYEVIYLFCFSWVTLINEYWLSENDEVQKVLCISMTMSIHFLVHCLIKNTADHSEFFRRELQCRWHIRHRAAPVDWQHASSFRCMFLHNYVHGSIASSPGHPQLFSVSREICWGWPGRWSYLQSICTQFALQHAILMMTVYFLALSRTSRRRCHS